MTTQPVQPPSDPQGLLAMKRALVHRVRREQRGAWFALLVFAAVRLGAAPVVRYGQGDHNGDFPPAMWYWPVALLLAYAAISWFYLRRSARRGLGTRVGPYLALGIALVVLITAYVVWTVLHPDFLADLRGPSPVSPVLDTIVSPAGTIGLALLLLARIERSWLLLVIACGYLGIMLSTGGVPDPSPWRDLPYILLEGGVLLLGGIGLAAQQRIQGRSAA
ncbi:hypothetical protein AB0D10_27150 [Kitasatospora sp. NPDC048545]|uniref:hypothetical protein n=1 Tax=Kitasatospora sp. NPDC048545 TaxID=3157208 RepID=UPI003405D86A